MNEICFGCIETYRNDPKYVWVTDQYPNKVISGAIHPDMGDYISHLVQAERIDGGNYIVNQRFNMTMNNNDVDVGYPNKFVIHVPQM